jgi:hypothetical protein
MRRDHCFNSRDEKDGRYIWIRLTDCSIECDESISILGNTRHPAPACQLGKWVQRDVVTGEAEHGRIGTDPSGLIGFVRAGWEYVRGRRASGPAERKGANHANEFGRIRGELIRKRAMTISRGEDEDPNLSRRSK